MSWIEIYDFVRAGGYICGFHTGLNVGPDIRPGMAGLAIYALATGCTPNPAIIGARGRTLVLFCP